MKTLLKGPLPEGDFILSCTGYGNDYHGCGSILRANYRDVSKLDLTEIDEGTIYSFICPECGARSEIPFEEIPTDILRLINGWN